MSPALDVTVQAQILDLLKSLQEKLNMSIIMISHDLGVIANICDEVAVMYAGQIVEKANVDDLFYHAHHPYTRGLLKSLPHLNLNKEDKLYVIDGQPPDLKESIDYCPFVKRCTKAMKICMQLMPEKTQLNKDHYVKCWLEHEFAPKENREEF